MRLAAVLLLLVVPSGTPEEGRPRGEDSAIRSFDVQAAVQRELRAGRVSNPEFQRRAALRRKIQQRGYAEVLYELKRDDPFGAVIAAAAVMLRLDFAIPRHSLSVTFPIVQPPRRDTVTLRSPPMVVPLVEDRTFPQDPWATDKH
jgi:hypothetical protein